MLKGQRGQEERKMRPFLVKKEWKMKNVLALRDAGALNKGHSQFYN